MLASLGFQAGFFSGLRAGLNLPGRTALEFEQVKNEDDYNAGYAAGWHLALAQSRDALGKQLAQSVEQAWAQYKG